MSQFGLNRDILYCKLSDVRPMANLLRCLSFRATGVCEVMGEGIKVTVEEGRSIQANAYLKVTTFSEFTFNPPSFLTPTPLSPSADIDEPAEDRLPRCRFGISLSTLLECLNIFGNAGGGSGSGERGERGGGDHEKESEGTGTTSLTMSYAGEGEPLILVLAEGGMVTRCEMTTYEPDELMDLPFDDAFRVQKLIIKSGWLKDAFSEIDPSSERLSITFSPQSHLRAGRRRLPGTRDDEDEDEFDDADEDAPIFRLEAMGTLGSTEMDYPDDREVLETFECLAAIRNTYKFSHIQLTQRALAASHKTSIRTEENGLISFQFMIPLVTAPTKMNPLAGPRKSLADSSGFVEFLCVPLEEETG